MPVPPMPSLAPFTAGASRGLPVPPMPSPVPFAGASRGLPVPPMPSPFTAAGASRGLPVPPMPSVPFAHGSTASTALAYNASSNAAARAPELDIVGLRLIATASWPRAIEIQTEVHPVIGVRLAGIALLQFHRAAVHDLQRRHARFAGELVQLADRVGRELAVVHAALEEGL